jgi:hypothetical protein
MRAAATALVLALGADAALTDLDRRALETLTAERSEGGVAVHYDPATVTAAEAGEEAARAAAALASLEAILDVRLDGPAHVFLYRDDAAFAAATGAPAHFGAFASGPRSVHLPRGAPVRHELTHLLARRFPGCADRDPGGWLREGLAVAMEREDRGVPVEAWAAVAARLGLLPGMADLRARWPEGPPRGVHPYHAAGSFAAWLLATAGLPKVKALYARPEGAAEVLGRDLDALEADWRAWLEARPVEAAHEVAVRRWLGLPGTRLPEPPRGAVAENLFDGRSLAGWAPRVPGAWAAAEGLLRGKGEAAWSVLDTSLEWPAGTALRVSLRAGPGAAVMLRLNRGPEASDEALLTAEGCLATIHGGLEGFARTPARLVPGRWTEAVLAQEGRTARLYLDGWLVLEAAGAFTGAGGRAGLGARGGVVEVRDASALVPR